MVSSTHEHHDYVRKHKFTTPVKREASRSILAVQTAGAAAPLQASTHRHAQAVPSAGRPLLDWLQDVERDWRPRGYTCDLFVDPPGQLKCTRTC